MKTPQLPLSLIAMLASMTGAGAQTWTPTASGTYTWLDPNWTAAAPNGIDAIAGLNINIAGAQIVNLDAPITVGTLNLGDSATGFFTQTIAAGTSGSLTFDVTSGNAVLARPITTSPGLNDTISAGITLNDTLNVRVPFVTATNGIILSGAVGGTGGILLTNPSLPAASASSTQFLDLRNTTSSFTGGVDVGNGSVFFRGDAPISANSALGNSATAVKVGGASSLVGSGTPGFQNNTTAELRLQASDDTTNYTFARDLDFSGSGGNAAATGRVRFGITGDAAGGLNTNTLTVSGNVILPEAETSGARGVEVFAGRQGQTIRFTGGISVGSGGVAGGATGTIYWGPGAPGGVTADGRSSGTYRFSDTARTYTNSQNLTNGTFVIEGSVGALGSTSPIGTQSVGLADGSGGNMFSANTDGAIRRIFMNTAGTSFARVLTPGGGGGSNLATSANISGVLPAVFQPLYGNSGSVNLLNGYEFGGTNTSGTTTYNGIINPGNVNVPVTGTAGGAGGTNPVSIVHNIALSAVGGGTVEFTGAISGSTAPTLGGATPGAVAAGNNTRITINQFRNSPNLDANVNGVPDANANALVGTATTGTVILSGVNTYGSTTEVLGGKLLVNGSIAGSTVTVATGATLGGSGLIDVGVAASTVQINGTLAPGNSAGIITSNKSVSFNTGSIFAAEITGATPGVGGYDQLTVSDPAGVSITGTSVISLSLDYAPALAAMFTLIDNAGSDAIVGAFSNLADDSTITLSYLGTNYDFLADYQGGTGNDLVLTAIVPEASTALLALVGSFFLGLRRRR
jgi:hypothetical protein